jgi:hypothetical protein
MEHMSLKAAKEPQSTPFSFSDVLGRGATFAVQYGRKNNP